MEFNIRNLYVLEIAGREIWITETHINTWIIMAILIVGALVLRHFFFKNAKAVPEAGSVQNVVEAGVETMVKFVYDTTNEKYQYLGSWFFGVIVFVGFSNISGLINLRPPTADISTTLALSAVSFLLIQVLGFKSGPKDYIKGLFEPIFLFMPMNIISEFATPISLGFRLFGNVLGGLVIMSLLYGLLPRLLTLVWPAALHAYFDIFSGLLQSFIFTILSMSFIMNKVSDAD